MISFLSGLILFILYIILLILFFDSIVSQKHIVLIIDLYLSLYLKMNDDIVSGFIKACLEFITSGEFIFDISAKEFVLSLLETGITFVCLSFGFYILATLCISENQ